MRESLRAPLRAFGTAAFVVGTLLFLLHPPSLSGAEDLLGILMGAVALILVTAWVTTLLAGDTMSEAEVDMLSERSEELAREPPPEHPPTDFDTLVIEAIDSLPPEFRELLETAPVVISRRGQEHRAYGPYFGDTVARETYPDRIVVYQDTLVRDFGHDPELLRAQVERTLRHELAHHLGWHERGVRDLGL